MKAEITFERTLGSTSKEGKSKSVDITYEGGLAVTDHVLSKNTVEILLGNVYKGEDGKSAYEIAVESGFEGSEQDWLESLKTTIDSELSDNSDNAIANKTVTKAIKDINEKTDNIQSSFKYDDAPTQGSTNLVNSGNIKKALDNTKQEIDNQLSSQLPAIEEAKNEAVSSIQNKENEAIQNFSEQRVTPTMLSEETMQLINASGGGTINNLPDGETLAEVELAGGTKAIGIPNRNADTNLGYIILKKNKSLIEQITQEDTIYEIRYSYDLGGETLTMPNNCVLKFEGGLINKGKIIGKNTCISASPIFILNDVNLEGDFNLNYIYTEWFGAESFNKKTTISTEQNGSTLYNIPSEVFDLKDSSDAFNKALNLSSISSGEVALLSKMYRIDNTVEMPMRSTLKTQRDTVIVANMNGNGLKKIIHNTADATFSEESSETPYDTLYANEFFDNESMAVAIKMSWIRTKIYGGGNLSLYPSRRTIGVLIESSGYMYTDMTYQSPNIDMTICGEKVNITSHSPNDLVGEGAPTSELGSGNTSTIYYWDKTNKKYYSRAVGKDWVLNNGEADSHWNTCIRFFVQAGSFSGRICNPIINCKLIYGARGIEVYIKDKGSWWNESNMSGSISYMYSNYISIYCGNESDFGGTHRRREFLFLLHISLHLNLNLSVVISHNAKYFKDKREKAAKLPPE